MRNKTKKRIVQHVTFMPKAEKTPFLLIALIVIVVMAIPAGIWSLRPHTDIYTMSSAEHVFGHWPSLIAAWNGKEPTVVYSIPLVPSGNGKYNYPGNPSAKRFAIWYGKSHSNPALLSDSGYTALVMR